MTLDADVLSSPATRKPFEAVVRDSCHVRRFLDESSAPRGHRAHGRAGDQRGERLQLAGVALHRDPGSHSWSPPCRPRSSSASSSSPSGQGWRFRSRSAWWRARRPSSSPRHRSASPCWRLPHDSPMEELMRLSGISPGRARSSLRTTGAAERRGGGAAADIHSAHAMGYGACWTCAPIVAGERLEQLLDVEPPARLVALVPIGRPAELPAAPKAAAARAGAELPLDGDLHPRFPGVLWAYARSARPGAPGVGAGKGENMPASNGTGPMGYGPMTGGRRGRCVGDVAAGGPFEGAGSAKRNGRGRGGGYGRAEPVLRYGSHGVAAHGADGRHSRATGCGAGGPRRTHRERARRSALRVSTASRRPGADDGRRRRCPSGHHRRSAGRGSGDHRQVGPNAHKVLDAAGIAIYQAGTGVTAREAVAAFRRGGLTAVEAPTVAGHWSQDKSRDQL